MVAPLCKFFQMNFSLVYLLVIKQTLHLGAALIQLGHSAFAVSIAHTDAHHDPHRMTSNNFGDPITFPLPQPRG